MALTPNVPAPLSYEQLQGNALSSYAAKLGINDFNVGSAVTSLFEVVSLMVARSSGDIFQILAANSIDRATGFQLQQLALQNNITPIGATSTTGNVNVIDTSFVKISTQVYAGANPPNIGALMISVSNAANFPQTGSIYIGRGTVNIEGPLPYTSIAPIGGFFVINLTSPTTKFHNVGETVILAQGGVRTIPTNTIVISPGIGSTADIQYQTSTNYIILDGETEVDNVAVAALVPGSAGNIPAGAIKQFSNPPFNGATVTNPISFTNGLDNETDDQLRVRLKKALASTGLGTVTAIEAAVLGATDSAEQATVVSDSLLQGTNGSTLYIDDGTGYEELTAGVSIEPIITGATGGEQFFQLATGGTQAPVAKAFLISSFSAPFDIIGGDTLAIVVGEQTYQHVFATTDFVSPGAATAYEITASINADVLLGFEATTSGDATLVVVRAIAETDDSLQTTTPTTSGRNAATLLGFPSNQIQTLRLYKNNLPLTKDGLTASVFTQQQALWSPTIVDGDTLILSVDGTAPITYTLTDAQFINTGLATSVSPNNTLASWAQVFNTILTGVTTQVVGSTLEVSSNLGTNNRASVVISGSSTLVNKGMFTFSLGLSSIGRASDFTLNRNTAQIELTIPLVAGDNLSAGTNQTEGMVESAEITAGSVTLVAPGHIWILIDAPGTLIPTGVASNTTLSVLNTTSNTVTYQSSVTNAFTNVLPGDYVIVWSPQLNTSNNIEGRVQSVTNNTLSILITPAEYAALVPQTNVEYLAGFVVLRSTLAPQKFQITTGTQTLDQIAVALNVQTPSIEFAVVEEEFLTVTTNSLDTDGSVLIVTADTNGAVLDFTNGDLSVSEPSLLAFYNSQESQADFPIFIQSQFASGQFADPINSYIPSFTSDIDFTGQDPNNLISILQPYGGINDAQPYGENVQVESYSGTAVNITENPDVRRLRSVDRFFVASPLDFGNNDNLAVVLDGNVTSESFNIPFFRPALTNMGVVSNPNNFDAYDVESGPTANFASAFGPTFDFSNFKVLMQAKKTLKPSPAQTALLYRSVPWGRSGEFVTVSYVYPSAPNSSIGNVVTVTETVNIQINLQSGVLATNSIDSSTEWNVTITPNTPVASVDQVTYTWNGIGTAPALTLSGGEYLNITTQSGFAPQNQGLFRVSTQSGFAPTATSFTVPTATGTALIQSNVATLVNNSMLFYQESATTAAQINTYVNANLSNYISSTIVNDSGTSGSGVIAYSTYEDSAFTVQGAQLQDGINWLLSSNLTSSPQFVLKNALTLPTDIGYAFNNGETIEFVPTTQDQVERLISVLAVTGFSAEGTISLADRGSRLELSSDTAGSAGSVQILGGTANSFSVPVLDTGLRVNNELMNVVVSNIAGQAITSDQWFSLQAANAQAKETLFSNNTSVSLFGNDPASGQTTISLGGRTLTQRYFGQPRSYIRAQGNTFKIEKQGQLVCLSWDNVGTSPQFIKTALNFNDSAGGTVNVNALPSSSDVQYIILTGAANFTELSIGDLLTVTGMPNPVNNGTFLVTGVSEDGTIVEVLNPNGESENSSGSFLFSANSTAGDLFDVGGQNLIAGVNFTVAGSIPVTASNLATAINTIPNYVATATSNVVTITSTASVPTIEIGYTGSAVISPVSLYTFNTFATAGDVFTVNSNNLVAGVNFAIGTDAPSQATNLAAAINALSGVTGTAVSGGIVQVVSTDLTVPLIVSYKGSPAATLSATETFSGNSTIGDVFTVDSTNYVAGSNFSVGSTQAITEANLAAAISTSPFVSGSVNGNAVIVTATTPSADVSISYVGSPVITVSGATLTGTTFVAGNFSTSSSVSEGDSIIVGAPFNILNQGTYRVIRRFNESVWFANDNVVEEEVLLPANLISLGFDSTTSFKVNASEHSINLSWNGTGTEPTLGNAQVGDVVTFGTDFASSNQGSFMVTESSPPLQQINQFTMPSGAQFPATGLGSYFTINDAANINQYYVWFNVNSGNTDPAPVGLTAIPVTIGSGSSSAQVATATALAIQGTGNFTAVATNSTVVTTTVGFNVTSDPTVGTMFGSFTLQVLQEGQVTFLNALNPSAVNQSAVTVTGGILQDNRPQIQFYEYDATIPGDQFVATGATLGLTNAGTYNIIRVVDKDTAIINKTLSSVLNASLNGVVTSVFVQEGIPYTGYKQVLFVASQPGSVNNNLVVFTTNAQADQINSSASVELTSINKENFSTVLIAGLNSYNYNIGLIRAANRIIYGDPTDAITFPGVAAAGSNIYVKAPLALRIQIAIDVRLNTGVPFAQMVQQVVDNITSLVNSNPVGQSISISSIISSVNSITGITAVSISSPAYSPSSDLIVLNPNQKAFILNPTDISVSQVGL